MNLKKLLSMRALKYGKCTVCNKKTIFVLNNEFWKIRNSAICIHCHSVSRQRHVAYCITKALEHKNINSYIDLRKREDITLYFAETETPLIKTLNGLSSVVTSEYFDDCKFGEKKNDILCQDLQNLTFENNTFDIVVSQDVLEHVQDWVLASKEIYRVLKPGGAHVFSIPFYFTSRTKKLFDNINGKFVPVVEPVEYHGDGIRGKIPTYNHFGFDILGELSKIGFDVLIEIPKYREYHNYGLFDCYTFIAYKRK
jgi:SAM-dependent methyltransferase